ncbi:hypothetical protein [Agrobacterium rosae]|uniref:Uncharacterized protein n=1 Tax=Agrobacterium rosae TaxID=1972867 RepID=A0AAE5VMV1_9HYPH|nr:hypothetical protein [Agrobacterium rosae]KAA3511620.1 hypothetical protein DXM21_14345 [Agrobacterium rosae]KAA3518956.1 hypothetical protein DXM25_13670 [Agrobacterium rosae]MQB49317.1 hypothetical protein [Agrobacterium rosae]POO49158.1 hypothetical protein CPJ18_22170 [Agrobacterium rosae]
MKTTYFFHLTYDKFSDIDQTGFEYSSPYKATDDAVLTLLTKALDAQIYGKPVPRKVVVVQSGIKSKIVAIKGV